MSDALYLQQLIRMTEAKTAKDELDALIAERDLLFDALTRVQAESTRQVFEIRELRGKLNDRIMEQEISGTGAAHSVVVEGPVNKSRRCTCRT